MAATKPKQLEGIDVAGRELRSASLEIRKEPQPKGCVRILLEFYAPNFQRPKKDATKAEQAITGFTLGVSATVKAFEGDAPTGDKEPPETDLLMVCQARVDIRYRVRRAAFAEKDVADCDWFYHAQLATFAVEHLRALLRDTRFSTIPIDIPLVDSPA